MGGSFKVGEVFGIQVKVHTFFLIWIGWTVLQAAEAGDASRAIVWNLILFGSVFLHELGHCAGARWVGGVAREVVLYPLGGLALLQTPRKASAEFISTAAGPAVNLVLAGLGIGVAIAGDLLAELPADQALGLGELLRSARAASLLAYLGLWVFGINALLFLFNVLPAFPMDGGRLFRSALWPLVGWTWATLIATALGVAFGIGFILLALWKLDRDPFLILIGAWVAYVSWGEHQRARRVPPPSAPVDDRMPWER